MTEMLNKFIDTVKTVYSARLQSVILYGSKAASDDAGKASDYNMLIILDTVRFEDLRAIEPLLGKWMKAGNPPPLMFSKDMFKESSDVFPMEFIDMRDNRRVLFGKDPFGDLSLLNTNLRHECEYELKSKLLKLRQGYMACAGRPKEMAALMTGSVSSFVVISRHVIHLLGKESPAGKRETLKMLGDLAGMDITVFETILRLKHGDENMRRLDVERLMSEYFSAIERIVGIVDAMA